MPLKKKKKTKVKKKVTKKVAKKTKVKKKVIKKKLLKKTQRNLSSKLSRSGLKVVQLQKANIKISIPNLLKIMMNFGKKKEKE